MEKYHFDRIKTAYNSVTKRLLLLDLEGTLSPTIASSDENSELRELLFRLTNDNSNDVLLLSSRTQEQLDGQFSYLPLTLVSENGGSFRRAVGEWEAFATDSHVWKEPIERAIRSLVSSYPSSSLVSKHFSCTWSYSNIHSIPHSEKKQLQVAWRSLARQHQLTLLEHFDSIEFIAPGVSKGKFAAYWVASHNSYDFILAIGDDATDEDLFETIGNTYFTIKVGDGTGSAANFTLARQTEVLPFLSNLTQREL